MLVNDYHIWVERSRRVCKSTIALAPAKTIRNREIWYIWERVNDGIADHQTVHHAR
jgi:hypothetical protein